MKAICCRRAADFSIRITIFPRHVQHRIQIRRSRIESVHRTYRVYYIGKRPELAFNVKRGMGIRANLRALVK